MVKIARLEEQIKLLKIENKQLRKYLKEQKFSDIENCNSSQSQSVQKKDISIVSSHCSCKTKCSTKKCGCVRRNTVCGQYCKCNTNICLNQVNNIFYSFFLIDL